MNCKLCKDCVNFLVHEKGKALCDYDFWEECLWKDAVLFCPEMFECDKYENVNLLIEKERIKNGE
jgi:hypothetical protein